MKLRVTALVLCFICIFTVFSFASSASADVDGMFEGVTASNSGILSQTLDAYPASAGFKKGSATAHGNNQTRILYLNGQVYVSTPMEDLEGDALSSYVGLWKMNMDGSVELLIHEEAHGIAAGASTNVMADNDGNVWVAVSWDEGSGFYQIKLWKYSPSENKVTEYFNRAYYRRGNMYGKPNSIYDPYYNRIILLTMGGDKAIGHILWFVFDINTLTWSDSHYQKCNNGRTDYHYAYADGKGGFYSICENCPRIDSAISNIEGMTVKEAISKFHSRYVNADYMWETSHMIYVPDATKDLAYNIELIEPVYDVEKGLYPNNCNMNNDIWLDTETGYLYSISTLLDSGVEGVHRILQVFDTNTPSGNVEKEGPFKLLVRKELDFLYGSRETYSQHYFKDTVGNVYIIATSESRGAVEVWQATDNHLATDFKLVFTEDFHGFVDVNSAKDIYATIIATNRNNSTLSDQAHMIAWGDKAYSWFYFSIDFAQLRSKLAK